MLTVIVLFIGIFENVLGFNVELSTQLVAKTTILDWVLKRIQTKRYDENQGYAAELLSILLQNNRPNRLKLIEKNGVEIILQVLSVSDLGPLSPPNQCNSRLNAYSNIDEETQWTLTRRSLWRTYSTRYVPR